MEFFIKDFTADLVTFTEEILNGKLHLLCSVTTFPDEKMKHPSRHPSIFSDMTMTLGQNFLVSYSFCKVLPELELLELLETQLLSFSNPLFRSILFHRI